VKKRGLIESVFSPLVHSMDIEHSRHCTPKNFICNLWGGLITYAFNPNKPHITPFEPIKLDDMVLI